MAKNQSLIKPNLVLFRDFPFVTVPNVTGPYPGVDKKHPAQSPCTKLDHVFTFTFLVGPKSVQTFLSNFNAKHIRNLVW